MPTLILKQKITKGYDHWLAAFDGAEDLRNDKYGIKTIYRGQDVNDNESNLLLGCRTDRVVFNINEVQHVLSVVCFLLNRLS